jgi:hypothetical protein
VNDAAATAFDTSGFLLNLAGVTAGTAGDKVYSAIAVGNINELTHGLRIKIGSTVYFLPLIPEAQAQA